MVCDDTGESGVPAIKCVLDEDTWSENGYNGEDGIRFTRLVASRALRMVLKR